jgi:hypothetical protein
MKLHPYPKIVNVTTRKIDTKIISPAGLCIISANFVSGVKPSASLFISLISDLYRSLNFGAELILINFQRNIITEYQREKQTFQRISTIEKERFMMNRHCCVGM